MSQKLPVNGFKWEESIHKSKEDFITNYDENSNKGYFFEVDVAYPKNLFNGITFSLHMDLPFLSKKRKPVNVISLFVIYMTKKTMLFT